MKAVILAGGLGTRLSEETALRPKPMVEVGGRPLLWHVMKIYASHGITDFVVCAGYRGVVIKKYFADYFMHHCDATFDLANNGVEFHFSDAEPWKVTVVDTGEHTMTGGRIGRIQKYIGDETFCLTYGDGVANVDIASLIQFHADHGKQATLTAVQPPGRFGALRFGQGSQSSVNAFEEKPQGDGSWINGGFFVLEPNVFALIQSDETVWEQAPMEQLAATGQLEAYRHRGFWQPMDTLRDRNELESLWREGDPPWLNPMSQKLSILRSDAA